MAKIMIVDDERDVLFVVRFFLSENGYKTAEATNGLAALELFRNEYFDLVITDLTMPTMDGLFFLREAKKLDPSVPFIILTSSVSADTAIEAMKYGAFCYVTKPFKADEILKPVRNALKAREASYLQAVGAHF